MKKITVNLIEKTIEVSKTFYKKATNPKTAEYRDLRAAMIENPTFDVVLKESDKKSYNGLDFDRMKEYIETQPNSEANLKKLERVMEIAETKGAKYPLTKQWFLKTFPEYKNSEVSSKEIGTTQNNSENITNIKEVA